MRFDVRPFTEGRTRLVIIMTRAEHDLFVSTFKERLAPSVESVTHVAVMLGPYAHQIPFMDVEVEP